MDAVLWPWPAGAGKEFVVPPEMVRGRVAVLVLEEDAVEFQVVWRDMLTMLSGAIDVSRRSGAAGFFAPQISKGLSSPSS